MRTIAIMALFATGCIDVSVLATQYQGDGSAAIVDGGLDDQGCPAGTSDCNGRCVNLQLDSENCGQCGNSCPNAQLCSQGLCGTTCQTPLLQCNMTCVDPRSDADHCGNCAPCPNVLNGARGCMNGQCGIASCTGGYADCDQNPSNGCEVNLQSDTKSCGACGKACAMGQVCANGQCADNCPMPLTSCNGSCVDTTTDPDHCGACATICAMVPNGTRGCSNKVCTVGTCNPGFANCDSNVANGCEVDLDTDLKNCGQCGHACANNQTCTNGVCVAVAMPDMTMAGPDMACAMCVLPHASATCNNNTCLVAKCDPGFGDCNHVVEDGCEADLSQDQLNCGGCGIACPQNLPSCVNGVCSPPCLANGMVPPNVCDSGSDPQTGARWTVCKADCKSAWLSHKDPNGGKFHALEICQSLGYTQLSCWDGTEGNVCGYVNDMNTSCGSPGMMSCTMALNNTCAEDMFGRVYCNTVQWLCLR
jgi:hypothetical protein